jgi:peptidyl-prolyl cis-trans isomerase D
MERLEELKDGKGSAVRFSAPKLVSRDQPKDVSAEALSQIFRLDASKLPVYAGLESRDGYTIYRVSRVIDVNPDEARERSVQGELGRASGQQEFRAFLGGLRAEAKVEINRPLLEKKN